MKKSFTIAATVALLTSCATSVQVSQTAAASVEVIRGVHNVGITVSDIDDTLAFYSAAVPYELVERVKVDADTFPEGILTKREGEVEIALIRTPTVFLKLIDIDPEGKAEPNRRPATGPGYTHICFQSPADASKYDRFKELGLDFLSRGDGPVDLGGYGVTYAYGFDHDGIMIETEQLDPQIIAMQKAAGATRVDQPGWLRHVANVTGDKAKMVKFYTAILGYGPRRDLPPMKRDTLDQVVDIDDIEVSASWFDVGNFELEFWQYHSPVTPLEFTQRTLDEIGYNGIVFEVTDLAGTVARLKEQEIDFAGESFMLGGWKVRYARDPEGNLIAFQERVTAGDDRSIEPMRLQPRAPG